MLQELHPEIPKFGQKRWRRKKPRLFVSYKSKDRIYALRLAYLANEAGFNYWMDVLDPKLQQVSSKRARTAKRKAVLVATIIEMALLNSSHVIATITRKTAKSRWVPYEFGRVKHNEVVADAACSWVHPEQDPELPEYLYLCPLQNSEQEVNDWLSTQRAKWEQRLGVKLRRPASLWTLSIPPKLP